MQRPTAKPWVELRESMGKGGVIAWAGVSRTSGERGHGRHNQLTRAHRDSQRLKWQPGILYGSKLGPLHISYGCVGWCPNSGRGRMSRTLFCAFGTLYLLCCLVQSWWFYLVLWYLVMPWSVDIPRRLVLFWRKMEEEWILERSKMCVLGGGVLGGVKGGKLPSG